MPPGNILLRQNTETFSEQQVDIDVRGFNQPLGSALPAGLETLWFSDAHCQPLQNVIWPSGLIVLGVGDRFSSVPLERLVLPASLCRLNLVHELDDHVDLPTECKLNVAEEIDGVTEQLIEMMFFFGRFEGRN